MRIPHKQRVAVEPPDPTLTVATFLGDLLPLAAARHLMSVTENSSERQVVVVRDDVVFFVCLVVVFFFADTC